MSIQDNSTERASIFLPPREGRSYPHRHCYTLDKTEAFPVQKPPLGR